MGSNLAHDRLAMVDYTCASRLLLLADDTDRRRSVSRAAEAASFRVVQAPLAGASEQLGDASPFDAIFLRVTNASREADAVFELLQPDLRERRVVIDSPLQILDWATSRVWGWAVLHVSDPSEAEQAVALGWALAREPDRLHDSGRSPSQLQQLSQEAGRIASALASLSQAEAERENGLERPIDSGRIRAIIRARRMRDQYLGADLFADPAWDMLLDLMAARLEGQRVPVSSLCMAAAVPPTTALRWIKVLAEQGVFVRIADPEDGRRIYIELADDVAVALATYLRVAQRISPLIF